MPGSSSWGIITRLTSQGQLVWASSWDFEKNLLSVILWFVSRTHYFVVTGLMCLFSCSCSLSATNFPCLWGCSQVFALWPLLHSKLASTRPLNQFGFYKQTAEGNPLFLNGSGDHVRLAWIISFLINSNQLIKNLYYICKIPLPCNIK